VENDEKGMNNMIMDDCHSEGKKIGYFFCD
jgi:hypothetical protein